MKHNIISHEENPYSPVIEIGLLDRKVNNRKKGIGEMGDLTRVTALRKNKDYLKVLDVNPG